ncbi:Ig-like domain-containing protein [Taibaiella soli]|uniref:Uncharacterized protein n=1 Tax=Taibaiella soli TaxID=1649169 RepID=A0A2W2C1M9_9BACT|nr:T9SS type B sorting domain-containing protein [Taibaiella soli]PZF73953.1 hypothetical protein DN068_06330 [Taibaiella soli]
MQPTKPEGSNLHQRCTFNRSAKTAVAVLTLFLQCSLVAHAQTAPVVPTAILACGTDNFSLSATNPAAGSTIKWYDDFYKTNLLYSGNTFSGVATQSVQYYAATFDNTTNQETKYPAMAYVFHPYKATLHATVDIDPVTNCHGSITMQSDTSRDSIILIPTDDAYVIASAAGTNYGSAAYAAIISSFYHSSSNTRAYYKFDLSAIPHDVTIEDARLSMTCTGGYANGNDGNIYANFVANDNWSESSITWTNRPPETVTNRYMYWIWRNNGSTFYLNMAGTTEYSPTIFTDNKLPYSNNANHPYYSPDQGGLVPFVQSEYAGDKVMSFALNSPGYETRWRTKEYATNLAQIPHLVIYYRYNDVVNYAWSGPNGFTSTQQNLTNVLPGTYHLTASNPFGCTLDTNIVIPNTVVATGFEDTICHGESVTFAGHTYTETGDYPNTFTNQFGCDSVVTLHLFVKYTPPGPSVSPYIVCQYDSVKDWNIQGEDIKWYDVPTGGLPLSPAPRMETGWPGSYVYYVTDQRDGCESARSQVVVNVNQMPNAPTVTTNKICINDLQDFRVLADSVTWYTAALGGVGSPKMPLPSNTVLTSPMTIYVSQTFQKCESDRTPVEIVPCCIVNVPDGFTPNGDNKNDKFQVISNGGVKVLSMMIYDRWGQQVYQSNSNTAAWDGTYGGTPAGMGTYFYEIVYSCGSSLNSSAKGSLTLVR